MIGPSGGCFLCFSNLSEHLLQLLKVFFHSLKIRLYHEPCMDSRDTRRHLSMGANNTGSQSDQSFFHQYMMLMQDIFKCQYTNGPQRTCPSASLHSVVPWRSFVASPRLIAHRSSRDPCGCFRRGLRCIAHGVSSILLKRT